MIKVYDGLKIGDSLDDATSCGILRIEADTDSENAITLQSQGFILADRTLKVSILLNKVNIDLNNFTRRCSFCETDIFDRDAVLDLAVKAFPYDRRFNVLPQCSPLIAHNVLKQWVSELGNITLAKLHEQCIGFLALKETALDTAFVHLAATDAKYRMIGVGMALYAHAIENLRARGFKKLEGRISSQNTAVMNIYAAFGGTFSSPKDIC